ncbi:MAG TPA: hypothetical protein VGH23_18195 [Rhizomicrobium sp.]|jgi:hypothetical protein
MEQIPWYSDAVLSGNGHLHRAGTLVQCVRKWRLLPEAERPMAQLKMTFELDGRRRLDGDQIAELVIRPGFVEA